MTSSGVLAILAQISPYISATVIHGKALFAHAQKLLGPPLLSLTTAEPDLISIVLLLVILWLSLLVLNQMARMVYGVVAMALKVTLLTAGAAAAVWVMNRGVEDASRDLGYASRVIIDYFQKI
ncbi:hypothetical protein V1517DRAFT_316507 [Lipomyces orientalis]|uniref:Uncharacterized protein n=1 Tax=Lipomyces orientalis TaxID=1233043 RepID=A0ACC3TV94_9ASCO